MFAVANLGLDLQAVAFAKYARKTYRRDDGAWPTYNEKAAFTATTREDPTDTEPSLWFNLCA